MGIREGPEEDKKNFVAEVLKVELQGPNRTYFKILDLPGAFESSSRVKKSDKNLVENMITHYMRQQDNIIM